MNNDVRCLQRCPQCPRTGPVIPGEGPADAKIIFIGEAPGKNENESRRPFVGKAGQEFNDHYLRLAGLFSSDVYVTNSVKCFIASSGKAPSDELVASCTKFHLNREINALSPSVVVPMGAVAGRAIGATYNMDLQAGIPFRHSIYGKTYRVFPTYHPALGLHKTGAMQYLAESFRALGEVISAEYERACDSGKGRTTYRELKTAREVEKYYRRGKSTAIDTETVGGVKDPPWCLTFSQDEASGYLIRAENKEAVGRFNLLLNEGPIFNNRKLMNLVYIHNCLFDLDILEDMGVVVMAQLDRLHDTMHGAYHLAKFPKIGLKNLAYRHLGIRMKDFDDVVTPHWVPLALRYVQEVNEFDWGKPPKVWVEDKKKGRYEKQPQSLNTGLKRMISDYAKSYCEDY